MPWPWASTVCFSSTLRPLMVVLSVTWIDPFSMASLWIEAITFGWSPSVKLGGSFNSPNRSFLTTSGSAASPASVSTVIPLASRRQAVDSSGRVNVTVARPSLPVAIEGFQ